MDGLTFVEEIYRYMKEKEYSVESILIDEAYADDTRLVTVSYEVPKEPEERKIYI